MSEGQKEKEICDFCFRTVFCFFFAFVFVLFFFLPRIGNERDVFFF